MAVYRLAVCVAIQPGIGMGVPSQAAHAPYRQRTSDAGSQQLAPAVLGGFGGFQPRRGACGCGWLAAAWLRRVAACRASDALVARRAAAR